jgi:hypothetical protein
VAFNDFVLIKTSPSSWPVVAARGRTVVLCFVCVGVVRQLERYLGGHLAVDHNS